MKLVRYGEKGQEKHGIVDDQDHIHALPDSVTNVPNMYAEENLAAIRQLPISGLPIVEGTPRLGACVAAPIIYGIGLNYKDHAAESGAAIPAEPIVFTKSATTISGPNDEVIIPKDSKKTDWEAELGVVIGKRIDHEITPEEALNYVAGYCVVNDVSERERQLKKAPGNWTLGKNAPTFAPLGPWMVTKDEIPDPQNLRITCEVNGKAMQDGNTKNMIFSVAQILSYMSKYMTIEPGTVISTGTPAGVAMSGDLELRKDIQTEDQLTAAQRERKYLKPGDTMRLEVEGLGIQRQKCVAYDMSRAAEMGQDQRGERKRA